MNIDWNVNVFFIESMEKYVFVKRWTPQIDNKRKRKKSDQSYDKSP